MSQQSPVADAACEETVSRPVEVVSSPMVETLPASSSAVVAQPARAQRGFKDVLADMCASMSVPQATALLVVVVALTGVTFPLGLPRCAASLSLLSLQCLIAHAPSRSLRVPPSISFAFTVCHSPLAFSSLIRFSSFLLPSSLLPPNS